jgi:2-polyprenyl-3-methyl-5-hydroxy-6-metoxy-1,4-benzoquinol methylase
MVDVFTAQAVQSFTDMPVSFALSATANKSSTVTLVDGQTVSLSDYSDDQLERLHFDQELAFTAAIKASPKNSQQRAETTCHAYQTVCNILDEIGLRSGDSGMLSMGMDARYTRLVLEILARQRKQSVGDGIFEVGFGSGLMLRAASKAGFRVAGLEVAPQLLQSARQVIPANCHDGLILGDFRNVDLEKHQGRYSLVYWNDVFEHIPVDEISDYLVRIRSLLAPGGKLLTITPNWHMRPSDVTCVFKPPRTEAIGFHLKEYTLREVRQLLVGAGFSRVQTPTYISRKRIWMPAVGDCTLAKTVFEPMLEWLPFKAAVQCCRRFGFNCTLATN